jgi:hypothetical protein
MRLNLRIASLAAATAVLAPAGQAVVFGQVDNFEDGTVQGWIVGPLGASHPAPPQNIPSGGPAGTDDNYLLLTSLGGVGAGSKLVVINRTQWAGNYTAAGISTITMHVNNFGSSDLHLRLLFEDPTTGAPSNIAISSNAVVVPVGSGWRQVAFPILSSDLTALLGSSSTVLTNTTWLRLFHGTTASFPPESVVASLGVDNISAVPEPATLAGALAGLALLRRRRR